MIKDNKWPTAYKKYLGDLRCPFPVTSQASIVDWLLGLGIQFEYGDNGK